MSLLSGNQEKLRLGLVKALPQDTQHTRVRSRREPEDQFRVLSPSPLPIVHAQILKPVKKNKTSKQTKLVL